MNKATTGAQEKAPLAPRAQWSRRAIAERCLVFACLIAVGWFYYWTAFPVSRGDLFPKKSLGYYNLQAGGFLKGELSLDTPVDPFLATLKNPWDPVQRGAHGAHDATYFNGKYYMYFGATPVLLLFLPVKLLTGWGVSETFASVLFSWAGLAAATAIVFSARRRSFPSAGLASLVGSIFAVGLITMVPSLLRRSSIWEVPITGAYACAMASSFFLYRALHRRGRAFWLGLASLALGLAVGSRPVYVFGCAGLLVPLFFWSRRKPDGGNPRDLWRAAAAALLPAMAIGVGLAWYNYARFGSVLEFGQKFQMAGEDITHLKLFDWAFPPYALHLYFLSPAGWTPYFPFVTVITPPPPPAGHFGVEDPYGIFPNMPFVFAALGLLFLGARRAWRRDGGALGAYALAVWVATTLVTLTVASFGGVTNRYMVDFLPSLSLLACLGSFTVCDQSWFVGYKKRLGGFVLAALLVFSALFNVLVSLQHNELLRTENPETYAKIAHAANYVSYAWDKIVGTKYAPVEMKVIFPRAAAAGSVEALLVTGRTFRSDYIYVHYLGGNSIRFGFEHTSFGGFTGEPLEIKPGEIQTVRINVGSLYPPAQHPFYDNLRHEQVRVWQRLVQVEVDDRVVLRGRSECYDATARKPSIGSSEGRPGFTHPFSGKVLSWRRAKEKRPPPPPKESGAVRIALRFPPFSSVHNEPLVCSGETGEGDLIFVRYESSHSLSFGHDDRGAGARTSGPVEVDLAAPHVVEIDYGALHSSKTDGKPVAVVTDQRTVVRLDGKEVMNAEFPYHLCEQDTVTIGLNPIGASSAEAAFTGKIERSERIPDGKK